MEEEGWRELNKQQAQNRKQVLSAEARKLLIRMDARDRLDSKLMTEDEMYRQEAEKAMEESEEQFDVELPVENKVCKRGSLNMAIRADILSIKVYSWHDKFRPRKPRFFNRVHTGYEWNKYNQTHYDHDNPPPKVVQGYKFNVSFSFVLLTCYFSISFFASSLRFYSI